MSGFDITVGTIPVQHQRVSRSGPSQGGRPGAGDSAPERAIDHGALQLAARRRPSRQVARHPRR